MVTSCVACGCTNRWSKERPDITFHRFPFGKPEILFKWISAVRRSNWTPSKYSSLCSEHFTEESYEIPLDYKKRCLKRDAVPEIFKFSDNLKTEVKRKNITTQVVPEDLPKKRKLSEKTVPTPVFTEVKVSVEVVNQVETLETVERLKRKIKTLQQKLRRRDEQIQAMKEFIMEMK